VNLQYGAYSIEMFILILIQLQELMITLDLWCSNVHTLVADYQECLDDNLTCRSGFDSHNKSNFINSQFYNLKFTIPDPIEPPKSQNPKKSPILLQPIVFNSYQDDNLISIIIFGRDSSAFLSALHSFIHKRA